MVLRAARWGRKKEDLNAVIGTVGRVYGVRGLRVVDASVVPLIALGHGVAPGYVVGGEDCGCD